MGNLSVTRIGALDKQNSYKIGFTSDKNASKPSKPAKQSSSSTADICLSVLSVAALAVSGIALFKNTGKTSKSLSKKAGEAANKLEELNKSLLKERQFFNDVEVKALSGFYERLPKVDYKTGMENLEKKFVDNFELVDFINKINMDKEIPKMQKHSVRRMMQALLIQKINPNLENTKALREFEGNLRVIGLKFEDFDNLFTEAKTKPLKDIINKESENPFVKILSDNDKLQDMNNRVGKFNNIFDEFNKLFFKNFLVKKFDGFINRASNAEGMKKAFNKFLPKENLPTDSHEAAMVFEVLGENINYTGEFGSLVRPHSAIMQSIADKLEILKGKYKPEELTQEAILARNKKITDLEKQIEELKKDIPKEVPAE